MYGQESGLSGLVDFELEDPASQRTDSIKIVHERSSLNFQTVHKTLLQQSRMSHDYEQSLLSYVSFALTVIKECRGIKIG